MIGSVAPASCAWRAHCRLWDRWELPSGWRAPSEYHACSCATTALRCSCSCTMPSAIWSAPTGSPVYRRSCGRPAVTSPVTPRRTVTPGRLSVT
eukprot:scaffold5330_cov59-Phaeocystis_antarctica.AAC.3